jgi:hypothetical protein
MYKTAIYHNSWKVADAILAQFKYSWNPPFNAGAAFATDADPQTQASSGLGFWLI